MVNRTYSRRDFLRCAGAAAGALALGGILMPGQGIAAARSRWWPAQLPPRGVVRIGGGAGLNAAHTLAQSVAGLAAQAVNAGRADEMIWIDPDAADYAAWYKGVVARLGLEERGQFTPWEAVARFKAQGVIDGYILYRPDASTDDLYTTRLDIDHSLNVATSVAGLLKGILVDEAQEAQAQALGLEMLFDARGKDMTWCFETYKDRLNRKLICTQDPKVPHNRAMAIAHQAFTVYGAAAPVPDIMAWLEPLSPVLGWNSGDEFSFTVLPTRYGHFNTATNWCLNLPLLSAAAENHQATKFTNTDPRSIDFGDARHAMSFVMSDGDNVQWLMGNFCRSKDYWGSPDHGKFPFGWTACVPNLMQLCPETVDYLAGTQPAQVSIIQDAGGYYYPDRFGEDREEGREALLRRHARRVAAYTAESGLKILWFICHNLQSPGAFAAYDIYAQEIDGLLGMFAIQYTPYEGGAGKIFWAQNRDGLQIPIVTAKYALWANAATGNRAGSPEHIAQVVNENVTRAESQSKHTYEWAIVHAWSSFNDVRGVTPVGWCIEQLDPVIKVVSPEELLWRVRMEYQPESTRRLIAGWQG
ncbi:MAG: twin-arginine translocation signal domain-containing protein [Anaerolineae bacterium]|nr:twin-arginine translocation signal domain-containing protein [Anaerolineae bacterium]